MVLLGAGDIGVHILQHRSVVQSGVDHLASHELVAHVGHKVLGGQGSAAIVPNAEGSGNVLALDALQEVLESHQVAATIKIDLGISSSASLKLQDSPPHAAVVRLLDLLV